MFVVMDESQDREYFVLGAVAAPTRALLEGIIADIRTAARRQRVALREFHEVDMNRDHPRLLDRALDILVTTRHRTRPVERTDVLILAAYYLKTSTEHLTALSASRLRQIYPALFSRLLWALPSLPDYDIVCDGFQGAAALLPTLHEHLVARGAGTVRFGESSYDKPLQLADLVAGTVRRHLRGDLHRDRFERLVPRLHFLGRVSVPRV
jgi:hypothetical protein